MKLEPKVTGLSPMTGPPGTKITVRGENLGQSSEDIIQLTVNGADCLPYLEWKSPKKITVRCTKTIGSGDIIITTKSGGTGTCDVQFNCHEQVVGRTEESAVWVDDITDTQVAEEERGLIVPRTSDDYSSDLYSTMFRPHLYLVQNYANADLRELEQLRENLQQNLTMKRDPDKNSSEDSLALYKTNLSVIMECLRILEHLSKLISMSKETSIDNINKLINDSLARTHEVFDPLLAQKDLVKNIESAMQVFKQNETLFNLPAAIDNSIASKDYDFVIMKTFDVLSRLDTMNIEPSLKQRISKDVTAKIEKLRSCIESQLHESCRNTSGGRNLEEVKKLISNLSKLDPDSKFDVWSALTEISKSLIDNLTERSNYFSKLSHQKDGIDLSDNNELPFVVQFIQAGMSIFHNTFYDVLALGQAYFDLNDEFACKDSNELRQKRLYEFEESMVVEPIEHLCSLLRSALLPGHQDEGRPTSWPESESKKYVSVCLKDVLQHVITCYNHLNKVNLPARARPSLDNFKEMIFEIRGRSLRILYEDATRYNKDQLFELENWSVEVDDFYGGRTELPLIFERKVIETLHLANDAIFTTKLPDEQSILKRDDIKASIKEQAIGLIKSFTDTLDKALNDKREHDAEARHAIMASKSSLRDGPSKYVADSKYCNRLLITMCNCQFTRDQIFPRLQDEFEKLGGPKMDGVFKICAGKYTDYVRRLRDSYCRIRCQEIRASKEDTQINLMIVNSQLYLMAPHLVEELMVAIVTDLQQGLTTVM